MDGSGVQAGAAVIAARPGGGTVELLRCLAAFSGLADEDLEQVAALAVPRRFQQGVVVFREGDDSDTCYIVRSGRARAVREHPDGRTITLANFGPGDIFGELAIFDRERRSATVEALEQTEVVALLAADMRRLMTEHPEITLKLIAALAQRLRATNERLTSQSFQTVQSRVAAALLRLARAARELDAPAGHVDAHAAGAGRTAVGRSRPGRADAAAAGAPAGDVVITSTQAEIGQLAGSSRESASRFLATLERAGIITQRRGRVVVHDAGALGRYVY